MADLPAIRYLSRTHPGGVIIASGILIVSAQAHLILLQIRREYKYYLVLGFDGCAGVGLDWCRLLLLVFIYLL